MTLRLTAGTAETIAGRHDEAAQVIDGSAGSSPRSVDAGYGAAYVSEILAAVSETAGEIAAVNTGIALLVRDAAADLGFTEAEVASQFDSLTAVVE